MKVIRLGWEGGINTYAYVEGNPLNKIDPTGKFAIIIFLPSAGEALVAAGSVAMAAWGETWKKPDNRNEQAQERKEYKRICTTPTPPTGDPCEDAKNNLARLKQCLSLRQKYSLKWFNDDESGHVTEIQNTQKGIKNLEDWIEENCKDDCKK